MLRVVLIVVLTIVLTVALIVVLIVISVVKVVLVVIIKNKNKKRINAKSYQVRVRSVAQNQPYKHRKQATEATPK